MDNEVKALLKKATDSASADEAMKYTQAANNAANALITLQAIEKQK